MTEMLVPSQPVEKVNHPEHYQGNTFEVIDIIEDYDLGFNLGNVIKYTLRSGRKDPNLKKEDLEKARWYLTREIEKINRTSRPSD